MQQAALDDSFSRRQILPLDILARREPLTDLEVAFAEGFPVAPDQFTASAWNLSSVARECCDQILHEVRHPARTSSEHVELAGNSITSTITTGANSVVRRKWTATGLAAELAGTRHNIQLVEAALPAAVDTWGPIGRDKSADNVLAEIAALAMAQHACKATRTTVLRSTRPSLPAGLGLWAWRVSQGVLAAVGAFAIARAFV